MTTTRNGDGPGSPGPGLTITLPIGIETSATFDADGIPEWARDAEHGYHHADARQVGFAFECQSCSFDLPAFDLWLSGKAAGAFKAQLLELRQKAFRAFLDGDDAAMVAPVQIMEARMVASHLHSPARTGYKASENNRERARRPRRPEALANAIKRLSARPGTAKQLWPELASILQADGCIVSDTETPTGQPAIEVVEGERVLNFSLKAFQNAIGKERKSR